MDEFDKVKLNFPPRGPARTRDSAAPLAELAEMNQGSPPTDGLNVSLTPAQALELAAAMCRQNAWEHAAGLCRAVLAAQPDAFEALNLLGVIARRNGRMQEAQALFARVVALKPDFADAHNNLGNALLDLGRAAEALRSHTRAVELDPRHAEAHNNRGNALRDLRRPAAALHSYDQALALRPQLAEVHNNRANALRDLGHAGSACAGYAQALALKPDYAEAHANLGNALRDLGRQQEALQSYERAIALEPQFARAHLNLALCRLQLGDFARGWAGYEWRRKDAQHAELQRRFTRPLWLGREDIAGKTLLLHAEQGYGDVLQFCRYAQSVAGRGARVVLEVHKPLVALLQGLPGVQRVLARGERLPAHDLQCPLMSLPYALGTTPQDIPAPPRLQVPAAALQAWQIRLDAQSGAQAGPPTGPRIGLAWSGNPTHVDDRRRSIALRQFAPALTGLGRCYSLQREVREDDVEALAAHPGLRHFGPALADFTDTAALCAMMDLVICVDTAVAHLAGTLGREVWLLLPYNPDWRWLLAREDSPWYPGMRLFRQSAPGDWDGVLARVRAALAGRVRPR